MSNQSPLDDDLAKLAQDWQSQPVSHIDVSLLLNRIKRRVMLGKLSIAINILMTISLFCAVLWGAFVAKWSLPVLLYLSFAVIFSTVFVFYELKIRQPDGPIEEQNTQQVVFQAISSNQRSIKYINLNLYSLIFLMPAMNWFIYAIDQTDGSFSLRAYLAGNAFILLIGLGCGWFRNKRVKELESLMAFRSDSQ